MNSFKELNLSAPVMQAIEELGFETPSEIQARALPILLGEPTDFLGLAATGTGKTAAFTIPLLERLNPKARGIQALILCPTRELAIQVAGQVNLLGKHLGAKAVPVYGGGSFGDQVYALKRGAQIVVGTPGRVVDHIGRGTLDLSGVETLILDEADEMISMGFKEDMEAILSQVTEGACNTWLFSATMSPGVRRVADEYLKSPEQVQINRTQMLSGTVEQSYFVTQESNKPEVLCKLIENADDFYGLVFCQTKSLVIDLHQFMLGRGFKADCLHGDMDQKARDRAMAAFRDRRTTVLICTDVASRGLDVKDITHVMNYSIPRELDSYVHRIGRTGRSGKQGLAMSLVTNAQRSIVRRVENMTKSRMSEGKIPSRKEIGAKKVARILATFEGQSAHERAVELLGEEWKKAIEGLTKEEITGRFLVMMYPEIFAEREEAQTMRRLDVTAVPKARRYDEDRPRDDRGARTYSRTPVVRPQDSYEPARYGVVQPKSPWGAKAGGKPAVAPLVKPMAQASAAPAVKPLDRPARAPTKSYAPKHAMIRLPDEAEEGQEKPATKKKKEWKPAPSVNSGVPSFARGKKPMGWGDKKKVKRSGYSPKY